MDTAPWTVVEVMPALAVGDLEEASRYYEALGVSREWAFPSDAEPTHVGLTLGPVSLMMALCTDRPIHRQNLYFVMIGVGAYREKLREALGEDVPKVVESDYRMRDFALEDPWGHLLTFGEAC